MLRPLKHRKLELGNENLSSHVNLLQIYYYCRKRNDLLLSFYQISLISCFRNKSQLMTELKTKPTDQKVEDYLNSITDEKRAEDCRKIHRIMQELTGENGTMWGASIVGYGSYHYKYESGREGDWMLVGFSNRKQSISLYIMSGFSQYEELLTHLGKHKTGKSCLYINKLADIDEDILREMIASSIEIIKKRYKDVN